MASSPLRPTIALLALATLIGACTGQDGSGDDAGAVTSTTALTTATTAEPSRAFVVPTTLAPLLSSTSTIPPDDGSIALDLLVVGDCVDIADAEAGTVEVGTARRHGCDEPHGLEIFHVGSLNDDPEAPYPGDAAVLSAADQMCLDAFAPYVGVAYVDSTLEIAHLRPDENVWLHGDRVVRCAVQDRGLEPLVGSMRDSAR